MSLINKKNKIKNILVGSQVGCCSYFIVAPKMDQILRLDNDNCGVSIFTESETAGKKIFSLVYHKICKCHIIISSQKGPVDLNI